MSGDHVVFRVDGADMYVEAIVRPSCAAPLSVVKIDALHGATVGAVAAAYGAQTGVISADLREYAYGCES